MTDDATLLRRYRHEGSDAAFAEVVRRHIDFVYRVALRRTAGHAHDAADVSQQVFTALARHADELSRHPMLIAWLHTATRHAAAKLIVSARRRHAREQDSAALAAADRPDSTPDWPTLRAVLDEAIDTLDDADRTAVILRFLEQRPFAEVGAALRLSPDAARMRTDRALEKLQSWLAGRGITSTAAALTSVVAAQPLVAAPAELATTLTARALAVAHHGAAVTSASTTTGLKFAAVIAATGIVSFSTGLYVAVEYTLASIPSTPPAPPQAELIAALRRENLSLRAELERLTRPAPLPTTAAPAVPPPRPPPPRPIVVERPIPTQP
jgi:RNA polymerase sigma factor (sigma-70 family)